MVNNGNNQQAYEQNVQFSGGQRSTQKQADWDDRNLRPPEPPGGRYDLWELQWCKWWGWTWVRKPEGQKGDPRAPSPSSEANKNKEEGKSNGKKKKKKGCCGGMFSKSKKQAPSEVEECGRESCPYSKREPCPYNNREPCPYNNPACNSAPAEPPAEPMRASNKMEYEQSSKTVRFCCECRSPITDNQGAPPADLCSSCGQPLPQSPSQQPQMTNDTQTDPNDTVPSDTGRGCPGPLCCSCGAPVPTQNTGAAAPPAEPSRTSKKGRLCCECRSQVTDNQGAPPADLCSSCGQALPQSTQPSQQPQMTNDTQTDPNDTVSVSKDSGRGCPGPLCCACASRQNNNNICQCGRPSCPPNCQCSMSKSRQQAGRPQNPQTVNMVKVYENNPHYLAEMFKLKSFDYACAHKPFNLLMRNNNRLMRLLTEKNSSCSPSGDMSKPVDASFALPESAIKAPLDDFQRKEHEHCKILTAVCDAILANHDHDKKQFNQFPESLQQLETFLRSKAISKDASAQSGAISFEELSDVEVQTEITMTKQKGFNAKKSRRKKELPDVHISTSNRTVIVGKHIRAESAAELKGSIPRRRSKNQSSDQSTISHPKASQSKKHNTDWNRTNSRHNLKCVNSNIQWRKSKMESNNLDTSQESSDND